MSSAVSFSEGMTAEQKLAGISIQNFEQEKVGIFQPRLRGENLSISRRW
jgi:hypothetical protein